ncbi:MAG: L-aspartate oxidase [Clostridiales bacterium]|nr:L-aspartate oxidase [Clostridiales bacterium]
MIKTDIVIVGCGAAGLFCALNLPKDKNIIIVTKDELEKSDSFLAQGGICVLHDDKDYDAFFEDTMKAGHYENNPESVDIMIRSSRSVIQELVDCGVRFEKDGNDFAYTKEGAHSRPRILFHEDETGKEITSHLLEVVKKLPNVTFIEKYTMVDIVSRDNSCYGIIGHDKEGNYSCILADYTVFATGGIGGLFEHSTNYPHLTGDALAIALKHNIKLQNIDYIQIHPTTLFDKSGGREFLISESVRGEGAILLNAKGERFVDELKPRDVVADAIFKEMKKDGAENVWLSMLPIPKEEIITHFPHIYQHCLDAGYDVTKQPIPVVPSQHYFMGGIDVDKDGKTSMSRLYAAGETACNGVHGKNRLASNSLLESLVWAQRSAKQIEKSYNKSNFNEQVIIDQNQYKNYKEKYKEAVLSAIEREKRRKPTMNNVTMKMNADELILSALKEDITSEDITTNSVMREYQEGEVDLICKQDGVIAGLDVFKRVFELLDKDTKIIFYHKDGDEVKKGQKIALIRGDIRVLLSGERTALNFLQRMSGIATYTRGIAKLFEGTKTKLLDTRKTTPNMRVFEKYAVKVGGGYNHRYNLSDGILLKDNHIGAAGGVKQAIMMAKEYAPFVRKIEVEVENLDMLKEALEAGADIIMLDNMSVEDMREAVKLCKGKAETECSGNVTKENVIRLVDIGVDYVSSGALTHSAPILDLSLKNLHAI